MVLIEDVKLRGSIAVRRTKSAITHRVTLSPAAVLIVPESCEIDVAALATRYWVEEQLKTLDLYDFLCNVPNVSLFRSEILIHSIRLRSMRSAAEFLDGAKYYDAYTASAATWRVKKQ